MTIYVILCIVILFYGDFTVGHNISVIWTPQDGYHCNLTFLNKTIPCSLGKNGVLLSSNKVEGDGCTPTGEYLLRRAFYRKDKIAINFNEFPVYLSLQATRPDFGWIDDVQSPHYNEFTYLPVNVSHENLFLTDSNVYDLMAVIGYNDQPVVIGKGSAIFFHVTETYGPTAGCIALALSDLIWVLTQVQQDTYMIIQQV